MSRDGRERLTRKEKLRELLDANLEGLTQEQRLAIPHFLQVDTIRNRCLKSGISTATYYRWMRDSEAWKNVLDLFIQSQVDEAKSYLRLLINDAITVVGVGLKDKDVNVRLKAANLIMDYFYKYEAVADLSNDIKLIKEKLGVISNGVPAQNRGRPPEVFNYPSPIDGNQTTPQV